MPTVYPHTRQIYPPAKQQEEINFDKNVFDLRVTERTHLLNNRTQIIIKFG